MLRSRTRRAVAALTAAGVISFSLAAPVDGSEAVDPPLLDDDAPTHDGGELVVGAQRGSPIVTAVGSAPAPPELDLAPPNEPPVAIASTPSGDGYWLGAGDGGVFAVGDARFHGSMGGTPLNEPVVAMAPTASGDGYWLGATDGGIFAFGDARFHGSMGGTPLNEPVVGMAPTETGEGYWMVASDGGIFAFGDAGFYGSLGSSATSAPIVGMEPVPGGDGYWLVTSDGEVHAFGDAEEHGEAVDDRGDDPISAIVSTSTGDGYWLVSDGGNVLAFGDADAIDDESVVVAPDRVVDATAVDGGLWLGIAGPRDHVVVWQSGGFSAATLRAIDAAAAATEQRVMVMHRASLAVTGVRRGDDWVQRVTPGWRVQFSAMGIGVVEAATVVGSDVARTIARGEVVMSARSAALRGAQAGDLLVLTTPFGARTLRIGLIAPDRRLRGTELVISTDTAGQVGINRPSTALIVGEDPAGAIEQLETGLPSGFIRVRRAGDPPLPNGVLSSVALKETIGEVEYRPTGSTTVALDPAWVAANIVSEELPIIGRITCHREAVAAMRDALTEVEQAGLAGAIDVADTRRSGGCYVPRLIRGSSGGFLSRHSFGIAIDVNPSTNPFGGTPTIDQRLVEIITSHGFAWGGTWTRPDGMHFEWLGGADS
ncbi:MAG: M15 family metallopeptidase [Actinomycetota bacterium]